MVTLIPATLITTYLEMNSFNDFQPAYLDDNEVRIEKLGVVDIPFYLFLYQSVGEKIAWRDRLIMPKEEVHAALSNPNTSIFVLYLGGVPAGYVELHQDGDAIEIAYFGLREAYHGRGLGKHLLSYGIQKAWDLGAKRVWVPTCNLDGEFALTNYEKRGFRIYDVTEEAMPEMAFKIAGSMGFKKALETAHPVLLEPIMTVEVEAPADHIGSVIGDLNARRGRILHVESKGQTEQITALVDQWQSCSRMPRR